MDEHAFPPTGLAVAWLGCSLHYIKTEHNNYPLKIMIFFFSGEILKLKISQDLVYIVWACFFIFSRYGSF